MKLVLGGVQIGLKYGLFKKRIKKKEIKVIENIILKNRVNFIDTAPTYGDSEKIIGNSKLNDLNILTKFNLNQFEKININLINNHVLDSINKSLKKLNKKKLFGLFIHNYKILLGSKGKIILNTLQNLKKKGIIQNLGISIYEPKDLSKVLGFWKPDMVQFPFNVLDQRILKYSWLKKLKNKQIKLFARSCFLQGLLLVDHPYKNFSNKFNKHLIKFHQWCISNNISKNEACINFVKQFKDIDYLILGFDSSDQIRKNIRFFNNKNNQKIVPSIFTCTNKKIIDPRKW